MSRFVSFAITSLLVSAASTSALGCIGALLERNQAIKATNAQAVATSTAAQAFVHTDMFVIADHVWLCPTVAEAKANKKCASGKSVDKNHGVVVIGQEATDGVWKSEIWDAQGQHPMFVLAEALNELPDTVALDAYIADVDKRYPAAKRIPIAAVTFADLVTQPKAYKGLYLIFQQPSLDMTNKDFASGVFTFTIPVPVRAGSEYASLAQFEFANEGLVAEFEAGERSYKCGGAGYCDHFVIVAEHSGRTTERIDEVGNVRRFPVFTVVELGDRYGNYRRD